MKFSIETFSMYKGHAKVAFSGRIFQSFMDSKINLKSLNAC